MFFNSEKNISLAILDADEDSYWKEQVGSMLYAQIIALKIFS